jgi:hypothetical protein
MPKNSQADILTDWETLLKRVASNAGDLPNIEIYSAPLAQLLDTAKNGLALSKAHKATKQEGTQDFKSLVRAGKDAATKLRAAVKAHFGPRSERLVEFGIQPLRPRKRNPGSLVSEKPKTVEPPSASPSDPAPKAS